MKDTSTKLGKTITIFALSALLAMSTFFNIFFLTMFGIKDVESFKKALLSKELLDGLTGITEVIPETDVDQNTSDTTVDGTTVNPQPSDTTEGVVVFNESDIKITYVKQEETGLLGPSFKFLIENNSTDSIYVTLTDVYVDGYLTYLSGGSTVSDVAPNRKAFVSLTIWESDYEDLTDRPTDVEYTILISNADTLKTIAEETGNELTIKW